MQTLDRRIWAWVNQHFFPLTYLNVSVCLTFCSMLCYYTILIALVVQENILSGNLRWICVLQ